MIRIKVDESEFASSFMLAMHVPGLLDLHGPLVLLHPVVHVLHVAAVLTRACPALLTHQILLLVFELSLALVVKLAHLPQLVKLSHSLLAHHMLCLLLSLLELLLDSDFSAHPSLHDLFGNSCVDGLESLLFPLELFFGDRGLFEVVLFFVFGEPLGEFIVVFEVKTSVGVINDFISGAIPEHLLGYSESLGELIYVVVVHFFALHDLYLISDVFTFLYVLLQLLLFLLPFLLQLLPSQLHV